MVELTSYTHGNLQIRRFELPNSGFMKDQPTNCYFLGTNEVTLVDAGSRDAASSLLKAVEQLPENALDRIVLTHTHPDHAGSIREVRSELGCPVLVHPMDAEIFGQTISWSEIDGMLSEDEAIDVEGHSFWPVLTPGHAPGHIVLHQPESNVMVAGDLVSGNGTIGIFPPHGNMTDYIASLRSGKALNASILYPGHGPVIENPNQTFDFYLERRHSREQQILDLLKDSPKRISDMIPVLYPDIFEQFVFAAESTLLAHLLKCEFDGRAECEGQDQRADRWRPV